MATYIWEKYTVATSKVYAESKSDLMTASYSTSQAACRGSAYTFNASTGIYTLTNPSAGTFNEFTMYTKYFMFGASGAGDAMYEMVSQSKSWGKIHLEYYEFTSTSTDAEAQGTYIEDVTSENASAYPTNGKHTDGYWYVYVGSKSHPGITGMLNVNGVVYELTGEGYVNINGVLCEMVDSYGNIDGVLKSLSDGTDRVKLPDGYTQVEYIQSSGAQWVDTGFTPNQDTRIDISAMAFSTADAGAGTGFIPYGAGVSYNSNAFECYTSGGQLEFNYANTHAFPCSAVANGIYNISHNKNIVSITGAASGSYTFPYTNITPPYTMTLFAIHRASVLVSDSMRLYSCKIYDNGNLIRDYIPCANANGEAGLYDIVNGVFYGNSGTGAFTAG